MTKYEEKIEMAKAHVSDAISLLKSVWTAEDASLNEMKAAVDYARLLDITSFTGTVTDDWMK